MKTIEEKIEDIANKILPCNTLCQHGYCDINFKDCKLYKDICNALTEVAKLQKEKQIKLTLKAFDKWLCENSWITRDEGNRKPLEELRNIIQNI